MDLNVRPLAAEDFDRFINYWLGLTQAEIERLGVAIDRLPSPAQMHSDLEAMLAAPNDRLRSFVLAWCINGEAIGHSSLKDIVPADSGSIHLHMLGRGFAGQRPRLAPFLSGGSRFLRTIQVEAHHLRT